MPRTSSRSSRTSESAGRGVAAVRLQIVRDGSLTYGWPIRTAGDAALLVRRYLGGEPDRETCAVIGLDSRGWPIMVHTVSVGTLNQALVNPREVYKAAIMTNCHAVIFAHTHPSGDASPSAEDRAVTERLRHAGQILGIELLDSIVLGAWDGPVISLRTW